MYGQNEPPTGAFAPPSLQPSPPSDSQPPAATTSTGWPRAAKITAVALGVLLIAVAAVGGVLISNSRSDADEAEQALADVNESLDSLSSDTESVEDQIDDLLDTNAELQTSVDEQVAQLADLDTQLSDALAENSELQAQVDEQQGEIDEARAAADAATSDLDAATAAAEAAAEPFVLEPLTIRPLFTDFVVPTNRVACDGFANPDTACPQTFTLDGRFLQDGTQLFMEFADVAKVPVGSFDGFTLTGETAVVSAVAFTCDGVDVPTLMRVTTSPVQYTVDPSTKVVTATAYTFTWTISAAEAGGCVASSRTYTGTLTF